MSGQQCLVTRASILYAAIRVMQQPALRLTPRNGHLQGILSYTRDRFRIAPRSCELDFGAPCMPNLAGAYATGASAIGVPVS